MFQTRNMSISRDFWQQPNLPYLPWKTSTLILMQNSSSYQKLPEIHFHIIIIIALIGTNINFHNFDFNKRHMKHTWAWGGLGVSPPKAVRKRLRGWNFPKNRDFRNFPTKVGLFWRFWAFSQKNFRKTGFWRENPFLTGKTDFSRHKFDFGRLHPQNVAPAHQAIYTTSLPNLEQTYFFLYQTCAGPESRITGFKSRRFPVFKSFNNL